MNKEIKNKVLDYAYDRMICKKLEIDYCNITEKDMDKIKNYVIQEMKKNEQ